MDTNPKAAVGRTKTQYHHIPPIALQGLAEAMALGAKKYGSFNWAKTGVTASDYYDAMKRHQETWYTKGTPDPESNKSHLVHIMACCAILLDCEGLGNLIDDRPIGRTTEV